MERRDLAYDLPEHLIAQAPPQERSEARLLVAAKELAHRRVSDLPNLLPPSLLVFNNTRVIPARLLGQKPTGGRVEVLLIEALEVFEPRRARWHAMTKSSKPLKEGARLTFRAASHALEVQVCKRREDGTADIVVEGTSPLDECIQAIGVPPLPPYIDREAADHDKERYQTVFASVPGAIAAPTAGLHFTKPLLADLRAAGHEIAEVTLHVGPGTFAPLRAEKLEDHPMHSERFSISEEAAYLINESRANGRPIIAIGTTVVRTLEAAADRTGAIEAGEHRTNLFIYPPYRFKVIGGLLTNFHLPYSTLLALVMATMGVDRTRKAYAAAIAEGYRFFSYGDAMLIPPSEFGTSV